MVTYRPLERYKNIVEKGEKYAGCPQVFNRLSRITHLDVGSVQNIVGKGESYYPPFPLYSPLT